VVPFCSRSYIWLLRYLITLVAVVTFVDIWLLFLVVVLGCGWTFYTVVALRLRLPTHGYGWLLLRLVDAVGTLRSHYGWLCWDVPRLI